MFLRREDNEYGTGTSYHTCDVCGEDFSIAPEVSKESGYFSKCLSLFCPSYDPHSDLEILFMSDKELANNGNVLSMSMLGKRKTFIDTGEING